ncbi:MAG: hypothetical protein IJL89_04110, partial [Firmicutes bacterium]|nr:hypothetical protein [Bacillota bacterium]
IPLRFFEPRKARISLFTNASLLIGLGLTIGIPPYRSSNTFILSSHYVFVRPLLSAFILQVIY